jgi:hypothetical protein
VIGVPEAAMTITYLLPPAPENIIGSAELARILDNSDCMCLAKFFSGIAAPVLIGH